MSVRAARECIARLSYKVTAPVMLAMLTTLLHPINVRAEDSGTPIFSFNGFGTLGAAHSSERNADFTSSSLKPGGAGYSHHWSTDVDSLIGGQVSTDFTPQWSAVLQVIAQQNYDNTYRPHIEWANIKYQFTPDFSVRIGRTVLPTFLLSDTRTLGYTYPWVRPPVDLYHLSPATTGDGIDISYRLHVGDATNTLQANLGKNNTDLPNNGGVSRARHLWGISNTTDIGALTVRIAYQKTKLTVAAVDPLFAAFRQFGAQGIALANTYDVDDKPFSLLEIGASYDPGNWFVMSEWGNFSGHSIIGKNTAWYVSSGYRIGTFTPYLTYSKVKSDNLSDPGLSVAALPAFLAAPASSLNAVLNAILSMKSVQNTISIGGRWDFMKDTDLKLQFDHIRISNGSKGVLTDIQPGFQRGGKVNLLSATIDFVF
ncbi:porin [Glaciimonas sp. GG7]